MNTFTIGQVAERTGFTTSTLRYYDAVGLVSPMTRSDAGYRVYDDEAVDRLTFIARAKQLGCSLDEITELLAIWSRERCGPVQQRFHELVTDKIRATQAQIVELIAFGSQLHTAATRLRTEPADGPCHDGCACLSQSSEAPIACTLQPDAMPERLAAWQSILSTVSARSQTGAGRVRLEFGADVDAGELARLAAAEQQCCAFFSFALTVDARGIALEIVAPEAAGGIVDVLFASAS